MLYQNHAFGAEQAKNYFNNLFGTLDTGERIEVRYKLPSVDHKMSRRFCENLNEAVDLALTFGQSHEVYVGVAPRLGKVGTKDGIKRLLALWGDLDCKGEHTSETRLEQLRGLLCPPSMLVWSGGGYHPYWSLKEPVRGEEELARAERVMKRIAEGLDGDPVHDLPRILRVPGTLNHKQDEPRPVRLVHHNHEQRYTLDQLEEMCEFFPEAAEDVAQKNEPETARRMVGPIQEGSRNNALTSLAGSMRYRGMSEEAILSALTVENENRCEPPLPRIEVRAIARSIGRYEAKDSSYNTLGPITFPFQVLPPTLSRFVNKAAAAIGCPPDFVAIPMLATLGSAIGNSRVLEVKRGWTEGATLYTVTIGDPGSSKSPALDDATAPASAKQEELGRKYREAIAEHNQEQRIWGGGGDLDLDCDPSEEPVFGRCIVQDTTIEALIERLGENPRGLLSSNDELSGWVRQQDQYKSGGKGTDRQFWLSAWSNQTIAVDRKGRKEPLIVYKPFVGLTGGIQPGILSELKNNREDGLLDRFLFAYPNPMPARWSDSEISEEIRAAYKGIYDELYGLSMITDSNGSPDPIRATFTASAKKHFIEGFNSLCEEMESPDFPANLKGPWSKMRAYLARLSLIIGMAYIVEPHHRRLGEEFYGFMKNNPMITKRHVKAAIELIEYFKAHARRVYAKLPGSEKSSPNQGNFGKGAETDKENGVAQFLVRFLKDREGYWEGMTSELYDICSANAIPSLPGGSGPFGKQIREKAQDPNNGFILTKGYRGNQPIVKLSLPTVGTLGNTGISSIEGTESRLIAESVTAEHPEVRVYEEDHLVEIEDALEQLFEEHPEHQEERDLELIAVELFWWNLLPFVPTEEEVKQVLSS